MAARLSEAAQTEYETLDYRDGRLHWSRGSVAAAVGRAGVKADKHEGDGATPSGTYPLVSVFYRKERISPPASHLPVSPLAPNDGFHIIADDDHYIVEAILSPHLFGAGRIRKLDQMIVVGIGGFIDPPVVRCQGAHRQVRDRRCNPVVPVKH